MFSILSYAVRFVVTNRAPKMSPFATRGGKWYNARRMKNLLFITDVKVDTIEQKLSGVYAGAKAFGWTVHEVELRNTTRTVDDFIEFWKPDGCIVDCDTELNRLAPAKFPHVAFVYLDVDERLTPSCVHTVQNDSKTCAEIAFRELERINPASYAFIPWYDPIDWSLRREEVFMDLARSTGRKAASFHGKWSKADVMSAQDAFAGFLAQLPHPCAVMATNDEVADLVLRACPLADLAVPGDVALVSVDNSVRLCENSRPTISSVQADFFEGGRVAVEILEKVVCKGAKRRFQLIYRPKEFVRRQSSRRLVVNDPAVEKALERIRVEACSGLKAADVLAGICSTRRSAERRFFRATGTSVLQEILNRRFDAVIELLKKPNQAIGPIANLCGWESENYLKRYFRKRTGLSMRDWREQHT